MRLRYALRLLLNSFRWANKKEGHYVDVKNQLIGFSETDTAY